MDKITHSDDPLEKEIAALEMAISNDNADIAELEALLVQKRQNLQMLTVEIRALKRAASLRPVAAARVEVAAPAPVAVPSAAPAPAPAPVQATESHAARFRNVVAQIRTTDPRLSAIPGG